MVIRGKNPVTAGSLPNNNSRTHRPKKKPRMKRGGGSKTGEIILRAITQNGKSNPAPPIQPKETGMTLGQDG